jgi:hypothetical protein
LVVMIGIGLLFLSAQSWYDYQMQEEEKRTIAKKELLNIIDTLSVIDTLDIIDSMETQAKGSNHIPIDRFQFKIIHIACEKDKADDLIILTFTLRNNSSKSLVPVGVKIDKDCTRGTKNKIDEQTFPITLLDNDIWGLDIPTACVERGFYTYILNKPPKKGIKSNGIATLKIKLFYTDEKGKRVMPSEVPIFRATILTDVDKMAAKSKEFLFKSEGCEILEE